MYNHLPQWPPSCNQLARTAAILNMATAYCHRECSTAGGRSAKAGTAGHFLMSSRGRRSRPSRSGWDARRPRINRTLVRYKTTLSLLCKDNGASVSFRLERHPAGPRLAMTVVGGPGDLVGTNALPCARIPHPTISIKWASSILPNRWMQPECLRATMVDGRVAFPLLSNRVPPHPGCKE